MRKLLAFPCTEQRYRELCDMFDGKSVDYALVSPGEVTSARGQGILVVARDEERGQSPDEVWAQLEIHGSDRGGPCDSPHGEIALTEEAISLMKRGRDQTEADWILDGKEPEGVSAADA